jgi:hypothetical protein
MILLLTPFKKSNTQVKTVIDYEKYIDQVKAGKLN